MGYALIVKLAQRKDKKEFFKHFREDVLDKVWMKKLKCQANI